MQKKINYLSLFLFLGYLSFLGISCNYGPDKANPYNLDIISTKWDYDKAIENDPKQTLVNLKEFIPGIILDIKYATSDNFTHQQIYKSAEAYLRLPAAEALKKVQEDLNLKGYGLKIFDAYRPYSATLKFYKVYPDTNFVAAPWDGSVHNRGCAVDLTLVDLKTGQELTMPTPFDDFTEKAAAAYMELPEDILANRQLLQDEMTRHGFEIYDYEWWHFNFHGWENYKIMDIPFKDLK